MLTRCLDVFTDWRWHGAASDGLAVACEELMVALLRADMLGQAARVWTDLTRAGDTALAPTAAVSKMLAAACKDAGLVARANEVLAYVRSCATAEQAAQA